MLGFFTGRHGKISKARFAALRKFSRKDAKLMNLVVEIYLLRYVRSLRLVYAKVAKIHCVNCSGEEGKEGEKKNFS